MADQETPNPKINAHAGFAHMTAVMSTWAPIRLAQTQHTTKALQALGRRKR